MAGILNFLVFGLFGGIIIQVFLIFFVAVALLTFQAGLLEKNDEKAIILGFINTLYFVYLNWVIKYNLIDSEFWIGITVSGLGLLFLVWSKFRKQT